MDFENAIKSLRSLFPSCTVEHIRAPSYIRVHCGLDEDIVLVIAKNKASTAASNEIANGAEKTEVMDLTGSPLKLDLSLRNILDESMPLDETVHWTRDELSHLPTSVHMARKVCGEYIKLTKEIDKCITIPIWVVTNGSDEKRTLLVTARPSSNCFDRGIVTHEGEVSLDAMSFDKLTDTKVQLNIECLLRISGSSHRGQSTENAVRAPNGGLTQLRCRWSERTLQVSPRATIVLEQEIIAGHEQSPCLELWKSICAVNSLNRALVDMTAAGYAAIDLKTVDICAPSSSADSSLKYNTKRLNDLLSEVETYTYTAQSQKGGCIFISDDVASLRQCLHAMNNNGSSNDFTYKLWDILKDCETAEDVVALLLYALKSVSSGKMKPFITPSNKSYLGKLVLKLSRGHSQTSLVLKNLKSNPPQALSLLGQLAIEKISWELTHIFTLIDNSFAVNNVLAEQRRSNEVIEQINQTIHDMTMGCGDISLNPFENKSLTENSIRLTSESILEDDPKVLSVDNFASLRKHGLVSNDKNDKRSVDEAPLVLDEIDVSAWKATLAKFAQLFVCLEHLTRMQQSLRLDMSSLTSLASGLQEYYLSEKTPVRTVVQLLSEPVQAYSTAVSAALIREHLNKKLATLYRVHIYRPADAQHPPVETADTTHVLSQRSVFPSVCCKEAENENGDTSIASSLKYQHTKYLHLFTCVATTFKLKQ